MSKAIPVYDMAFPPSRLVSTAYKAGALDALLNRLDGCSEIPIPYQAGSAEADAYRAGRREGHETADRLRQPA